MFVWRVGVRCISSAARKFVSRQVIATNRSPLWIQVLHAKDRARPLAALGPYSQVIQAQDLPSALAQLSPDDELPEWLAMYLVIYPPQNTEQAIQAAGFALARVSTLQLSTRVPFMLLVLHTLIQFDAPYATIELAVEALLAVQHSDHPELHFNELLYLLQFKQSLSEVQASPISNDKLISRVLREMKLLGVPVRAPMSPAQTALRPDILDSLHHAMRNASKHGQRASVKGIRGSIISLLRKRITRAQGSPPSLTQLAQEMLPYDTAILVTTPLRNASSYFQTASLLNTYYRDPTVSSRALLASLDHHSNLTAYTIVIKGCLHRNEPALALSTWEMARNKFRISTNASLKVGIQALAANHRLHAAFLTLDAFALRPGEHPSTSPFSARCRLTSSPMDGLLNALVDNNRPDVVFRLWDGMKSLYDLTPDNFHFRAVLRAAILASEIPDANLREGLADLGEGLDEWGITLPWASQPSKTHTTPTAEEIAGMLEPGYTVKSGRWRGRHAAQVARDIFRTHLFAYFPRLHSLPCPIGALPSLTLSSSQPQPLPSSDNESGVLILDRATFEHYISLLPLSAREAEIPLTLAWMHALNLQPHEDLLCKALIHFGEVARLSPAFERGIFNAPGSYGALLKWLGDWLGPDNVPTEDRLMEWRRERMDTRKGQPPEQLYAEEEDGEDTKEREVEELRKRHFDAEMKAVEKMMELERLEATNHQRKRFA